MKFKHLTINCQLSIVNWQLFCYSIILLLFFASPVKAQVTIGSQDPPQSFSLLELTTNLKQGGLRLPQIPTTKDRDAISNAHGTEPAMMGLEIFNLETYCVETWNGSEWISQCANITPSPLSNQLATNRVATFTNVMYDFQRQTLAAYLTPAGTPIAFQWEMSVDGGNTWNNIVGATDANYIIPADFMYDYAGLNKNDKRCTQDGSNSAIEVFFRCLITDNSGATGHTPDTNLLKMLFIRTNTDGYSIDPVTNIRYLTIQKGASGDNKSATTTGTMKIALLNLGQSGTGAWLNGVHKPDDAGTLNNADDLGDFYQWGRIADGHEHIVWTKNTGYNNVFGTGISDPIAKNPSQTYTSSGQISSGDPAYGKFITIGGIVTDDWGKGDATSHDRWGDGALARPATEITWSYQENNPCPSGWRVPSRWNLWDICVGDGSSTTPAPTNSTYAGATVNSWSRRDSNNGNVGGAIITNKNGEKVFIITSYFRSGLYGTLNADDTGDCWVSTYADDVTAYYNKLNSTNIILGTSVNMASGFPIRCVAE